MTGPQRLGNWLAPRLMHWWLGSSFRDMPPLKACRISALESLALQDTGHGFTIELLIKAHRAKLRIAQLDAHCRLRRGGVSKVSGNLRGASRAAVKIVLTIAQHAIRERVRQVL